MSSLENIEKQTYGTSNNVRQIPAYEVLRKYPMFKVEAPVKKTIDGKEYDTVLSGGWGRGVVDDSFNHAAWFNDGNSDIRSLDIEYATEGYRWAYDPQLGALRPISKSDPSVWAPGSRWIPYEGF
jgi:hypothetical protein